MARDQIFSMSMQKVGDFVFDQQVVDVFPDMIARSVPGYASILSMIEQLAARFVLPQTNVYDLGCSLGAATRLIRRRAPASCVLHAIDNSPAMIQRLQGLLAEDDAAFAASRSPGSSTSSPAAQASAMGCQVLVTEGDVRTTEIHNASFAVLNLTLQFIAPDERQPVLQSIFDGLVQGGALLLSEKICFDEPAQQMLMTELHHEFKRSHGYSDLEIAQKRTSIENRLIPESLERHVTRLRHVGFSTVAPWFQCFNFVSILAVKSCAGTETARPLSPSGSRHDSL